MLLAVFTLLGGLIGAGATIVATSIQNASSERQQKIQIEFQALESKKQRLFDAKKDTYVNTLTHFMRTIRNLEDEGKNIDISKMSEPEVKDLKREMADARKKDSEITIAAMSSAFLFCKTPLWSKLTEFARLVGQSTSFSGEERKSHLKKMLEVYADINAGMREELDIDDI